MRRVFSWIVILILAAPVSESFGATGRVIKVLPHFLDLKGRVALSPSLYDRDAYQVELREHPEKRSGIRFDMQWRTRGAVWSDLKLRVELRGVAQGEAPKQMVLERDLEGGGLFSHWTSMTLVGQEYKTLGEVTAWRVTLWEGTDLLGEQKSFLW
jgi:hypothetical protein